MTEVQIWTVIGVLAAALTATITVSTQLMMRTITALIGGLQTEMVLRFQRVDGQFEAVDRRFEQVDQRFEQVDQRLERLDQRVGKLEQRVDDIDRDVQAIARHIFPDR